METFILINDLLKTTKCLKKLRYDQTKTNIPDKTMYQNHYDAFVLWTIYFKGK